MKRIYAIIFLLITIFVLNCTSEERYNRLINENQSLNIQIDTLTAQIQNLKFGASTLLSKAKLKIEERRFDEAKLTLTNIVENFSNSTEAYSALKLLKLVNFQIETEFFSKAKQDTSCVQITEYLKNYPEGKYAKEANIIIEEKSWKNLLVNHPLAKLKEFKENFPNSTRITNVQNVIDDIENRINSQSTQNSSNENYNEYDNQNVKTSYPSYQSTNSYNNQQTKSNYSARRTGAICRDGTRSYATGRGACSHHGGVSEWIYE